MFTHVTRQVFIRCRIWRHDLREVISKHKHAVRHFWAILLPAAPVVDRSRGRRSGLLKVPNRPNKSLVLHHAVLTRSVDTARRKKRTRPISCIPDASESLQMALYISNVFGHILKQFLPFRIQYDFLVNLRCYSDSMLGQLHMYIRDIGSFLVP